MYITICTFFFGMVFLGGRGLPLALSDAGREKGAVGILRCVSPAELRGVL